MAGFDTESFKEQLMSEQTREMEQLMADQTRVMEQLKSELAE